MVPKQKEHIPVLLNEVLALLDPQAGESYLDLTAGYGGHASEVLGRTLNGPATLIDRDKDAAAALKKRFKDRLHQVVCSDFLSASRDLLAKAERFDLILADLGVSSAQLDTPTRGFAFMHDGPLDMRMDTSNGLTAGELVNSYSESKLAELIKSYGEEPRAKRIARAIVASRPVPSTKSLAEIVAKAAGKGKGKIHPATRTFQALRIAVNDELSQLEQALPIWVELLKPGGRLAVISFHSLEDRLVKRLFSELAGNRYDSELRLLSKKPVTATGEELVFNPRARSAKLRAVVKIKTPV
jgi:16S rRNA (cytosine1402-N4)-methyltransferase